MKFVEVMKKVFTQHIPLKLLAAALAFVTVIIVNAV
jgi:hypothetical protein